MITPYRAASHWLLSPRIMLLLGQILSGCLRIGEHGITGFDIVSCIKFWQKPCCPQSGAALVGPNILRPFPEPVYYTSDQRIFRSDLPSDHSMIQGKFQQGMQYGWHNRYISASCAIPGCPGTIYFFYRAWAIFQTGYVRVRRPETKTFMPTSIFLLNCSRQN